MTNLLFWNRESGQSHHIGLLRANAKTQAMAWVELTHEIDIHSEIERALGNGCDTIVAAGGDGTVNAVVNALMRVGEDRRPALAIIPLGTANDFAGTLGIPNDITQACALLWNTRPAPVDIVRINGIGFERFFANVAAGGNCVRVSEQLTDELKSRWGPLCYLRGSIGVLTDMETYHITADIDGERFEGLHCWAILVANGRTNAGRIEVAPEACAWDGMLDIIIIKDGGVMDMVEIVAGNLTGKFLECDQVIFRQATRLCVQSDPPMRFTLDGEVIDEEPVEFNVVAGAVRMFVGEQRLGGD
ncbi:MAG: diacylglycerol kinase family lipid kinase [Pirellulaceae bacterium]